MTSHVAAVLVLVLVGLPLVVLPSWSVAVLAAMATALCAGGIATRFAPVLTAGATLAVIEYAVALWIADGALDLVTAIVFGAALFLLLEVVDVMGRLHDATVGGSVIPALVRYWLAVVCAGAGIVIVLTAGAAAVRLTAPLPSYPAAAAVGALGALVAAIGVLRLVTKTRDLSGRGDSSQEPKEE